ncbi:zinc finger protein 862-like [Bombina bombina]|uniref:zinc finger protein 862-like n=1 Tax=Bombina bombina TaxID=8345 RepID=UPI00235ADA74|nr:zinc finger protein 862-like [Bombina bombina]
MKLEGIRSHELSSGHLWSVQCESNRKLKQTETPAGQAIATMTKAQTEKLKLLFRNAHLLAIKSRPFSDFPDLCKLDKMKGLDVGDTYLNAISARAVVEEEIIYARFAIEGKVHTRFVALQSVEKADAETISQAVNAAVTQHLDQSWKEKLVAIGTDGAAVMLGKNGGVVQKLKGQRKHVVAIHCMSHRLELSVRDTAANNESHQKLKDLLLGLYLFYHKSALNRANLKNSYASLKMRPLLPTRADGTRWVGHFWRALDHFLKGYKAIIQHLDQVQSPDAKGVRGEQQAKARCFYRAATSLSMVQYACFMYDVLLQLCNLSNTLQNRNASVADVHNSLEVTKKILIALKERPVPGSLLHSIQYDEEGTARFEGVELKGKNDAFKSSKKKFLEAIQSSFEDCFEDIEEGVLQATSVTSFKTWPDKENSEDFGNEDIVTLTSQFQPVLEAQGVSCREIVNEWTVLKTSLYNKNDWEKKLKTVTWPELNREFGDKCGHLLSLMDLILTLPVSTSECERGFSKMKMIKSDWRSSLITSTLSDLMIVNLHSAPVDQFDPSDAVRHWATAGPRKRNVTYKRSTNETSNLVIAEVAEVPIPFDHLENDEEQAEEFEVSRLNEVYDCELNFPEHSDSD